MRKNIFENEEEAREFAKILYPTLLCDTCVDADEKECIKCIVRTIKDNGIIRPNAYEELMECFDLIWYGGFDRSDSDRDNLVKLKTKIQAYHDEKHSLSPAVKEAREKTFNALFDYIIRILSTIPGVDTDKLNQLVQDVIQSERQIVDAMIKEKE